MDQPADDILTRPLGAPVPEVPGANGRLARLRRAAADRRVRLAALALFLGGTAGAVYVLGDPLGGEPRITTSIAHREAPAAPVRITPVAEAPIDIPTPKALASAEEVESASGVVVTRPSGTAAPADAVVIRVPSGESVRLAAAPDPRLIERGRHGTLPRLGEGRLRPLDVYARPPGQGGGPRIAIVLTGLGIGQSATAAATVKLPPAISLAFAPYGSDLERSVARARDFGHEVLLQAPMEPFDYPDSDPGPQTLLTGAQKAENLDRLAWVMSRFPGYVGVVNFMGGKLLADPAAAEPILREIASRGLGFVDDGTTPRGLDAKLAEKAKLPAVRADVVIDAVPRADAIDKELARLEAEARQKGIVIASAAALPITIERLGRWAQDLEGRGIRLVPVSTALRDGPRAARLSQVN